MSVPFTIGGEKIGLGTRRTIQVQLPLLYTHTPVVLSVQVIRGRRGGPCLFVSAAVHGDEINGTEIIRRLIRSPALRHLRGTLIAVLVVNVYGFVRQSRYLPDRRDLNHSFPGSEKGSLAARLANVFLEEVVTKADYGIDLHTGAVHLENLPQARVSFGERGVVGRLAIAFGSPVILNTASRDGSLREAVLALGTPVLVYEGGKALRFDELVICAGLRGVIGVMREPDMLRPASKSRRRRQPEPVVACSSQWVQAPQSGILRAVKPLGSRVEKQEILGWVADPLGENEVPVEASAACVVIGKLNLPLVNEGEALYHIARFAETDTRSRDRGTVQAAHDPGMDVTETVEPPISP